jgi:DNA/RNA-binding domain of Phe-tRNA-synthetase-like protein
MNERPRQPRTASGAGRSDGSDVGSEQRRDAFLPHVGWRSPEIEEELPQLRLLFSHARLARPGASRDASPRLVKRRLSELSDRFKGAHAVGVRRQPVPAAYRIFYRQIGLDPEVARTPIEEAVLDRMLRGGFLPGRLLEDVLLIALIDTGVPVWALDAAALQGSLGVRVSDEGEPLGRADDAWSLPGGRLVVADGSAALGLLFGEMAKECVTGGRTREVTLFAVQVSGVPSLYIEEALWSARSALEHVG